MDRCLSLCGCTVIVLFGLRDYSESLIKERLKLGLFTLHLPSVLGYVMISSKNSHDLTGGKGILRWNLPVLKSN